jgi:hypothetical protein
MKLSVAKNITIVLIVLMSAVTLMAEARADSYEEYVFTPVADTRVNIKAKDKNSGGEGFIAVRDMDGMARSYINFGDLSSLNGKTIISSSLYLYQSSATYGTDDSVNIHNVTGGWTEDGLTWRNQPSFDSEIITSRTFTSEDNAVGWRQWSGLENLVASWSSGSVTNYGIMLENDISGFDSYSSQFHSKEYSSTEFRPYLSVTMTPEPISSALFILGGVSLAVLRKRKKK